MKKKQLLAYILCLTLVASFMPQAFAAKGTTEIKNIIYMIPDGGGMDPYWLADDLKQAGGWDRDVFPNSTVTEKGEMYSRQYLVGGITTRSADAAVTDSAAAGTALSSGYKTNNGYIGSDPEKKPHATILETAQLMGKKTGMVTIYEWSNATPASFSAHEYDRAAYSAISEQIVNQDIDVVLGAGFGAAKWGSIKEAEIRGYDIINTREDLEAVKKGDKIWGNLLPGAFPYDIANGAETPSLAEMTNAAITALADADDDGFFLMVEGSKVDGGGHANYTLGMVGDFLAFDVACEVALKFAEGRDDTIVVICPDHDTGGMNVPSKTGEVVEQLKKGIEPAEITWTSTGHTDRNGGLFMYVPKGVEYPEGIYADAIGTKRAYTKYVVDNTVLAPYMAEFVGMNLDDATSKLFVDVTDLGTYNSDNQIFKFTNGKGYNVSIKANTSYAYFDDKAVSLNGQVAVYLGGRFYVPELLIDIMDGTAQGSSYSEVAAPFIAGMDLYMQDGNVNDIRGRVSIGKVYEGNSLSGKITFKYPEALAVMEPICFDSPSGEAKHVIEFDASCLDFSAGSFNFEYEVEVTGGHTYSLASAVNGFVYAGLRSTPIEIDGVLDEEAWSNSTDMILNREEQIVSIANWKGDRDLSGRIKLMWDEEYFYLGAVITDEIYSQTYKASSCWQGDSIQFGIYSDTALMASGKGGKNFDEIGIALVEGVPAGYRFLSQGKTNTGELVKGDSFQFECTQSGDDTIYEMKISWKELTGGYITSPKIGDAIGFSALINDNDGEGRRGYMEYGSGIGATKNTNEFVVMSLIDPAGVGLVANDEIKVVVNGEKVDFDVKPTAIDGRVLVPVRAIFEKLGATVDWDQDTQTVFSDMGDTKVSLTLNDAAVVVNGERRVVDVPAQAIDGRTLVPVRAVSESYNCDVSWDGDTQTVIINN